MLLRIAPSSNPTVTPGQPTSTPGPDKDWEVIDPERLTASSLVSPATKAWVDAQNAELEAAKKAFQDAVAGYSSTARQWFDGEAPSPDEVHAGQGGAPRQGDGQAAGGQEGAGASHAEGTTREDALSQIGVVGQLGLNGPHPSAQKPSVPKPASTTHHGASGGGHTGGGQSGVLEGVKSPPGKPGAGKRPQGKGVLGQVPLGKAPAGQAPAGHAPQGKEAPAAASGPVPVPGDHARRLLMSSRRPSGTTQEDSIFTASVPARSEEASLSSSLAAELPTSITGARARHGHRRHLLVHRNGKGIGGVFHANTNLPYNGFEVPGDDERVQRLLLSLLRPAKSTSCSAPAAARGGKGPSQGEGGGGAGAVPFATIGSNGGSIAAAVASLASILGKHGGREAADILYRTALEADAEQAAGVAHLSGGQTRRRHYYHHRRRRILSTAVVRGSGPGEGGMFMHNALPVFSLGDLIGDAESGLATPIYRLLLPHAMLHPDAVPLATQGRIVPSAGLVLITALLRSGVCRTIDVYGVSKDGWGNYFANIAKKGKPSEMSYMKLTHVAGLEYFALQVAMANGLLCLKG
eukprot:jgi/Mesvir1/20763/Mv12768-RA.1